MSAPRDLPGPALAAIGEGMARSADLRDELASERRRAQHARSALLGRVFEIGDAIDRALETGSGDEGLLRAFHQQVHELYAAEGIAEIRPVLGERPSLDEVEVVATVPAEGRTPGIVTRVIQPGYRDGSRIVRRARVQMSKES